MKKIIMITVLLFSVAGVQTVSAHPHSMRSIKGKQIEQQIKISRGIRTGRLTPKEAQNLEMQQAKIQHDKQLAKCDGVISPCERAYIKAEQSRAGKNIFIHKHNRRSW